MTCRFRKAVPEDFLILKENSTENGKIDQRAIDDSVEIRVMECDGEPVMAIGYIRYDGDAYVDYMGVWGMFSKDIKNHVKEAVRFCKDLMFSRVGTKFVVLIDESNPVFKRFVEFFGFQRTKVVEEWQGILYHIYVKEN
jgi:hypothetical protein